METNLLNEKMNRFDTKVEENMRDNVAAWFNY